MLQGHLPAGRDDGRDPNAINQQDRLLNCVGCHTPTQATGESPSEVEARHLSFVWAPIFSDLLIHEMPEISPERRASTPLAPFLRTLGRWRPLIWRVISLMMRCPVRGEPTAASFVPPR